MDDKARQFIEEASDGFWQKAYTHLRNAELVSKHAGTGVIIFGLVATVCGIAASNKLDFTSWSASTIGIWGAGLAVACAFVQKILEKDHVALLEQAKLSLDRSQAYIYQRDEIKRTIGDMKSLDIQRMQMQAAFGYMLEHLEQILVSGKKDIKNSIDGLFDLCQAELLASMGMTYSDKMTISVYQVSSTSPDGEQNLEILFNKKPNKAEEQDYKSRSWKKGEGYSGQAWMLANEVIVPDTMALPASLHTTKLGAQAEGDLDAELRRYRSVASVPIFVGSSEQVWGVVSVTTNQPNKFSKHAVDDDVAQQNVETVRILAKVIAVLVACCANGDREPPSLSLT